MYFVFFIGFEIIFIFLFCGVALFYEAARNFIELLPWLLGGAGVGLLYVGVFLLGRFYSSKTGNPLFTIAKIVMFLTVFPGILSFAEPMSIDECSAWFSFFGPDTLTRIVTFVLAVIIGGALIMSVAAFTPLPAQIVLLIACIASPVLLYNNACETCSQSYSRYQVTNFTTAELPEECTVTSDATIYYPALNGEDAISSILPLKYTTSTFAAGEVVYLPFSNYESSLENGRKYVLVSNGEQAGLVETSLLQKNETPTYQLFIEVTADSAEVYGCNTDVVFTFENGNEMTENTRTGEVVGSLNKGTRPALIESEGNYLLVTLEDGRQGYISRDAVKVVRTPLH